MLWNLMGNLQESNVFSAEEKTKSLSSLSSSQIGAKRWALAERAAHKIISQLQPTVVSDTRRFQVINYVRRLIRNLSGFEVFPYGSVPLKTYLPDGDIDLTAFGGASVEEALAKDVVSELQREENDSSAEFVVKEIRLIHAEVKLVKCLVQNIVVDISFNQIGGLCTLCFLEQVDRFIGKDHLFKRSILLIKAWCYYESRILGAHHGLISTYALETLVLYIFQVFHPTLDGPLAVLYKFLDYFSNFDWKNYCITLRGPVRLSSSSEFETEIPENIGGDMLLTEDFYRHCLDTFSVPFKDVELHTRIFPRKHLNIVDPLKEFNNLGRSVSEGNFYRIKSAFTFGARKLGQLLMQSGDSIAIELRMFFSNTLDRHGSGQRPDVQDTIHMLAPTLTHPATSIFEIESNQEGEDGVCIITALDAEMNIRTANGQQIDSTHLSTNFDGSAKGSNVQECHLSGDAEDHAVARLQGLQIENESQNSSNTSTEKNDIQEGKVHYAPHLYFCKPSSGYGESKYGNSTITQSEDHENRASSEILQGPNEEKGTNIGHYLGSEIQRPIRSVDVPSIPNPITFSEDSLNTNSSLASANNASSPESLDSFDLLGDFNTYFNCLRYGRWFYEFGSNMQAWSAPPRPPLPHFQSMNSWDAIQRSSPRNRFSNGNVNGYVHGPVFYPINPMFVPGASYGSEDMPKPCGTGTYFPNMNHPPHGYRPSSVKGRIQAPARSPRNGRTVTEFLVDQNGGLPGYSDGDHSASPRRDVNASILQPNGVGEIGPFLHVPPGAPFQESSRQPRPASSYSQSANPGFPTPGIKSPKAVVGLDDDRSTLPSSYHLKDEDDFPPLSI